MKKIIFSVFFLSLSIFAFSQEISGSWGGSLSFGQSKLPLVINISYNDSNILCATLDSPKQGAKGIPITSISYNNNKLVFNSAALGASYKGEYKNDTIFGTFSQNGMSFPLKLMREDTLKQNLSSTKQVLKRTQEPQAPYPYISENVKFRNEKDNITLSGTLTYPKDASNFPTVILVSGSGPQNRNEEVLGHKPFLVISDYLTRKGIAVLRYDDRGVDESEGVYKSATINNFASDATSALMYLKKRKEINNKKIGILGHSEGGTIAFIVASESKDKPAFIISLAGMAIPGDSLLQMQRSLIAQVSGVSKEDLEENEVLVRSIDTLAKTYPHDSILNNIDFFANQLLPEKFKSVPNIKNLYISAIKQRLSPELNSLLSCNPRLFLQKITCPVLAIGGEKDLQVPAEVNLNRIKSCVKAPVLTKIYPNLNHLFQHCKTGLPDEYSEIEETISEEVLKDISVWIKSIRAK